MKFFRCIFVFLPALCLVAQPQPPKSATPYLGLAAPGPAAAPSVAPDKVVLTVGDSKLTAAQFDAIVESLPQQYRANARGAGRKQFAESLVRIMILADEGKRRKIDETPAFQTQARFQELNLLAGETYAALGNGTPVDDAALRKYYDEHKGDYEQVRARHILIRMNGSPLPLKPGQKDLTEQEALAKCQELRKEIEGGADFGAVAKRESDDTGSASNGGDLNFFHRGQMVPPFEEAAFALKVGEVSQPVKSPFGYHLIKVEAKESKTFEQAKPEIESKMRPDAAKKALEDLEKKATVVMDPAFFGAGAANPAPATK